MGVAHRYLDAAFQAAEKASWRRHTEDIPNGLSNEFGDRIAVDNVHRPAARIFDRGGRRIESELVIQGRHDFAHVHWTFLRRAGELMPPPAMMAMPTLGQWSRPPFLTIFGERPNSPQATTVTSSSRRRLCKSVIKA